MAKIRHTHLSAVQEINEAHNEVYESVHRERTGVNDAVMCQEQPSNILALPKFGGCVE